MSLFKPNKLTPESIYSILQAAPAVTLDDTDILPVLDGESGTLGSGTVSALTALLSGNSGLKVQKGTYVGTGKAGSSNYNSLSFDFDPVLFMIHTDVLTGTGVSGAYMLCFAPFLSPNATRQFGYMCGTLMGASSENPIPMQTGEMFYAKYLPSSRTLRWWGDYPDKQCNFDGITYTWTAIG